MRIDENYTLNPTLVVGESLWRLYRNRKRGPWELRRFNSSWWWFHLELGLRGGSYRTVAAACDRFAPPFKVDINEDQP